MKSTITKIMEYQFYMNFNNFCVETNFYVSMGRK